MKRLRGRLNIFQITMLEWREQHPYTAVHALRLPVLPDRGTLAAAIDAERAQLGLGTLELDRRRHRYGWRGWSSTTPIEWIAADGCTAADLHTCLEREIERQMNTPFAGDGALDPFRFFAVPDARSGFLGIAYDHFVAGGDSIVDLLNRIAARLAGAPRAGGRLGVYPHTHLRLFLRHPLRVARAVARMPAMTRSCRRTLRPRYRDIAQGHNGFALHRLDAGCIEALRNAARCWGVTFNDLLLALLLLARDRETRSRLGAARRRELGAASVMNLREMHGEAARDAFGQFLGSFRISHPVPPGITLEALARDVHRDTARIKREHLYLAGLLAMRVDRIIGHFQTPRQRMSAYAKGYPVNAGTSTLNVDALWDASAISVPEYLRGVPTGPLAPMVLAATTAAGSVCIGISFRTAAFARAEIDAMWAEMLGRIRSLQ
ncbi:MAG TPA: hypothetical protein VF925_11080 [Casimicrobiaceae bacterium]